MTPASKRPAWLRYGIAAMTVAAGWAARTALTPVVGPTALPFIFFFPGVALAAWFGRWDAGAFAAILSSGLAIWAFFDPVYTLSMPDSYDVAGIAAFLFSCALIVGSIQVMHVSRRRLRGEAAERERVSAALEASRDTLSTTLASIGDAVIACDANQRITFLNREAQRLTRWTAMAAEGRPVEDVFRIVNEESGEPVEVPVARVLREGRAVGLAHHAVLVGRDGSRTPIADSAAPIRQPGQPPEGVVLTFRDVTAQRAADLAHARLAAIVEFSGDAILAKTLDGIIQSWNAGAERLFGYRADETVGRPVTMLIPADRRHEEVEILDRLHRGQAIESRETVRITKDGRLLPVLLSVSPLRDGEGRIVGASTIMHDSTAVVAAREALRQADRRKDEFLAILAHELRNPLAPIRMAIGMLQRTEGKEPRTQELLSVLDRQSQQLTRLLDDLLDISRIGSGKIALRTSRMQLNLALADAVEAVRPAIESMKHSLEVTIEDVGLEVEGDLARLAQVFTNLLNNAAKYMAVGGQITLTVSRDGQDAVIRVRDTGIGLTPPQLPRIFEMFAQGDQPLEHGRSGLGVGLALSKTLVELHRGRIEAHSEGPGRGSEFVVRLPALPPAEARPAAPAEPEMAPPMQGLRILVADDNVDAAMMLADVLKLAGHTVLTAHDGAAVIAAAEAFHPDVAILDIGMPKINGYEVASQLRERFGRSHLLIAVTGWGQDEDRRRALAAGFDHHLTKPVDLAGLYRLIGRART